MPSPFAPSPAAQDVVLRPSKTAIGLTLGVQLKDEARRAVIGVDDGKVFLQKSISPFLAQSVVRSAVERGYYIDFEGIQHDL